MDIRKPGAQDLAEVQRLWAACFETEEEPFFQWFFSRKYVAERALGIFDGESLLSALHINPYTLKLRGMDVPSGYLLGVATHAEYRQQGHMTELLRATLVEMRRRQQPVSMLLPRRPGIYTKHGWEICYHTFRYYMPVPALLRFESECGGEWLQAGAGGDISGFDTVYRRYMENYHGYVVRSMAHWRDLIAENEDEGGQSYVLAKDGRVIAYAIFITIGEKLLVKELAYDNWQARNSLFRFLGGQADGCEAVEWQLPTGDPSWLEFADERTNIALYPFSSGRIVDVTQALALYQPPTELAGTIVIAVTDPLSDWNNGVFSLTAENGRIAVGRSEDSPAETADAAMTIGTLSQLFFGAVDASTLAAAGRMELRQPAVLAFLQTLFPRRENAFYEYF